MRQRPSSGRAQTIGGILLLVVFIAAAERVRARGTERAEAIREHTARVSAQADRLGAEADAQEAAGRLLDGERERLRVEQRQIHAAQMECARLARAAARWAALTGESPRTLAELARPLREGEEPYVEVDDDPWTTPYRLETGEREMRVLSAGADLTFGTADDISHTIAR